MGKKTKIIITTLSLIAGASGVCIAVPFIKDMITGEKSNPGDDGLTPNDNIVENEEYFKVVKNLEDAIEISLNNPIKDVQIENIKADEENMSFYTLVTVNNATQSIVNYRVDYNNTNEVYTKYEEFINKDLSNVTEEEISTFWGDISTVTSSYTNVKSVKGINKVKNDSITALTKSVIMDYNNSDLNESDKAAMSSLINSYDNIEIVESYFISRGYDRSSDSYLYDFNGIAFVKGYQAEIHSTVACDNMINDTSILSDMALELYNNNPEKYNVIYSKASILNYAMVNGAKTSSNDELSMWIKE